MSDVNVTIGAEIGENDVVLFMKGTTSMPQCGFSSRIAGVLNYMEVTFKDINVLANEELRQGIKEYSELADNSATLCQGRVHRRL